MSSNDFQEMQFCTGFVNGRSQLSKGCSLSSQRHPLTHAEKAFSQGRVNVGKAGKSHLTILLSRGGYI